jgi:hypothetical protein
MPLTTHETELVDLIDVALKDAYPGRELMVTASPHFVGWVDVVITEHGPSGARRITEPVNRDGITSPKLRDLRDSILDSVIRQLGRPGRVA